VAADNSFIQWAAPGIHGLSPYVPGKPVDELEREYGVSDSIKLASNENPLGPPRTALDAMQAVQQDLALYPDGGGFHLKQALARKLGVGTEQITLGNGSNDVLVLLAETFLTPDVEAVYSQYAFVVYQLAVQATGAVGKVAPARPTEHAQPLGHDLEAMAALVGGRTRMVFIANPNNPTGTWLGRAELRQFVAGLPRHVIVVVDEAYAEYVHEPDYPDTLTWIDEYPNVVVTRTFSKIYGLAGLRVGYSVSHPDIADLLNRVRQPFNVNSLAQVAAIAALSDRDHVQRSRQVNRQGLEQLTTGFRDLGLAVSPSAGNFLLVDTGHDAAVVYQALLRSGIIVRPVANYGLPRHLRITVGTPEQNERLLSAMTGLARR